MTNDTRMEAIRGTLISVLPEGTSHGEIPTLGSVYLPRSHVKALHPDSLLVTGMRGAGKTFWWSALQNPQVRELVARISAEANLNESTEVLIGFGVLPEPDRYPNRDILNHLLNNGMEARLIWRTVQAQQLAPQDHPLRQQSDWRSRTRYVHENPEPVERLFYERDKELERKKSWSLILFDALDRCAGDWKGMYQLVRGLLQMALDMRAYRRLRVKVFLRSDQLDESEIANFPDASKVLSSKVELSWPRNELYGLLWHYLANASGEGVAFKEFSQVTDWNAVQIGDHLLFSVPRRLIFEEEAQRDLFHAIAGEWMGRDRRRGFPYTWIPNHLADTEGRASPRSFLVALRKAAENTRDQYPGYDKALHYESIKRGVQEASKIRVRELQEDYPWVHRLLQPLQGMVVPCNFDEVVQRWNANRVPEALEREIEQNEVKLPPAHIGLGSEGIRQDLESLGIFMRTRDGRVNIPDVFRVGYGLGRRGGVQPIRKD